MATWSCFRARIFPVMAALSFNWRVSADASQKLADESRMAGTYRFNIGRPYARRIDVTSRLWTVRASSPARWAMPAVARNLQIFGRVDIEQLVRPGSRDAKGPGVERLRQSAQRQPSGGQLPLHDRQNLPAD